jgi:hypothetical protein
MAEVVVLGADLSGTLMAYELLPQLRPEDRSRVVGQGPRYHFVLSNPWGRGRLAGMIRWSSAERSAALRHQDISCWLSESRSEHR